MLQPVQLFKLLADETRSTIVMLLRESGEMCVCDICTATTESQPKISRHMALLRESELVVDRREGKWVHYRLSPQMPAWAAIIIDSAWNCEREKIRNKLSGASSSSC
ncbi:MULTISPECIES: metalloregulator ArsR/SmtB family transcription factor [Yersinia]|uniref:metalloregulator ArsR/SmtB family transcription factor n=1 Tax=Yersinia TaxID=629 RepID=UPI0011A6A701|nr:MULTISPECIES: metalloregulator ArsR/SmtB family transcription factor [Yersinia]MDA5544324.1 metalloregulator ArsR/SmtB family transcription factor [Yersinia rochesterensis]MDN0105398.1 metalloregulator ArsR/SmtB family transcription factor [Yersinia rochesterensis]UZM76896.1 metalloregulator ArsR/SmtB family transcription factor [Yersinia sp. SCPM-O-B-9106 (C-191)]